MTRENAIDNLKADIKYWENTSVSTEHLYMAIKALEQEQKTGHWVESNIGGAKVCSACNAHMGLSSFKFCPNCGADMRGEK